MFAGVQSDLTKYTAHSVKCSSDASLLLSYLIFIISLLYRWQA